MGKTLEKVWEKLFNLEVVWDATQYAAVTFGFEHHVNRVINTKYRWIFRDWLTPHFYINRYTFFLPPKFKVFVWIHVQLMKKWNLVFFNNFFR